MLDAVAAGLDGILDAAAGMGVGGDMLVVVARDLDGCLQFLQPILDGARILVLRRIQGAGGHHLDQIGAHGELLARGLAHFLDAVGGLVHAGIVVGRGGGDGQQPPRQEQTRSDALPGIDGVAHGHLDIVPAADIARRGDAAEQRALCRLRRVQCHCGVRSLGRRPGIGRFRRHGDVDVAIDQAGQQPGAADVDDPIAARRFGVRGNRRNAVAVDRDVGAAKGARLDVVDVPAR